MGGATKLTIGILNLNDQQPNNKKSFSGDFPVVCVRSVFIVFFFLF